MAWKVFRISEVNDNYHTVGLKLLSAFKWIKEAFKLSKLKWILKLDDDVLLNVEKLLKHIKEYESHKSTTLYCSVITGSIPIREKKVKSRNNPW